MRNGRIALPRTAPSACALPKTLVDVEAARPRAPAAGVVASTLRRVSNDDLSEMFVLPGLKGRRKHEEDLRAAPISYWEGPDISTYEVFGAAIRQPVIGGRARPAIHALLVETL
jgi:hypothetical protein